MPENYNPMLARLRNRAAKSAAYSHSSKQETRIAKKHKGYKTPGSGSKRQKGDVRIKGIARIECKATSNKSFSVTREMLYKISNAVDATGELPVLQVEFLDQHGKDDGAFLVIDNTHLEKILEYAKLSKD